MILKGIKDETLRDLFTETSDMNKELADKYLQKAKDILAQYLKSTLDYLKDHLTNDEAKLILHLTNKIEIALESCVELLNLGFYGSANAIYRQAYEYVVWLKMYISMDTDKLHIIQDAFWGEINNPAAKKNEAIGYMTKHFIPNIPEENQNDMSIEEIKAFGKEYYAELCALTHGTCNSQQILISDDSYHQFRNSLYRLSTLLCMATQTTLLAYKTYGMWCENAEELATLIEHMSHLYSESEDFMSSIDSNKGSQISAQVAILKGVWTYKG